MSLAQLWLCRPSATLSTVAASAFPVFSLGVEFALNDYLPPRQRGHLRVRDKDKMLAPACRSWQLASQGRLMCRPCGKYRL